MAVKSGEKHVGYNTCLKATHFKNLHSSMLQQMRMYIQNCNTELWN